jgi:hypothetical protein
VFLQYIGSLSNSILKDTSLIKPMFGSGSTMGKVISVAPTKISNKMEGTFKGDLNAFIPFGPAGLGKPNNVLKKFVR